MSLNLYQSLSVQFIMNVFIFVPSSAHIHPSISPLDLVFWGSGNTAEGSSTSETLKTIGTAFGYQCPMFLSQSARSLRPMWLLTVSLLLGTRGIPALFHHHHPGHRVFSVDTRKHNTWLQWDMQARCGDFWVSARCVKPLHLIGMQKLILLKSKLLVWGGGGSTQIKLK